MNKIIKSEKFWRNISFLLLSLFLVIQFYPRNNHSDIVNKKDGSLVKTAHASELYEMFSCPCCGEALNPDEPCCGAMTQMIDFIDLNLDKGLNDDEVVLATAKEFGIERLINEQDRLSLRQKLIEMAPEDAARIEMKETKRDLGDIARSKGVVSTDFELTNTGKSDLIINKLSSSCGCTSAAIVYKGQVSPKFTMEGHGQDNPKDWEVYIKPGDSAILRVYYDPMIHPDFTGAATRTVSIMSNDPVDFEKKVIINLEQI